MEMVIDQVWEIAVLRVKSLRIEGGKACLTFQQPESIFEFEHPWPPVDHDHELSRAILPGRRD